MSYPPPPGLKPSSSIPQPPSLLPPRPPPSVSSQGSFKPAFASVPAYSNGGSQGGGSGGFGGFTGFQPRSIAASSQNFRAHSPVVSALPAPPAGFSAPTAYAAAPPYQPSYQQPAAPSYYPQQQQSYQESYAQPAAPQIRNPFAPPMQGSSGGVPGFGAHGAVDPELEAQIAQWQSAYTSKDDAKGGSRTFNRYEGAASATGANSGPLGARHDGPNMSTADMTSAANADSGVAAVVTGADGKQKTVVRSGGGATWTDSSLLEWDPAHFRLFVGNLAGEVTDDSLLKAFARYSSVQKARVVRDKRTTKSKGYGFVSFSDGEEYFQAARDMQGKYIGSHPVLLRKSTTEIRAVVPRDKKKAAGKGGKGGSYAGPERTGAGVQKKQSKTKGGLKVLG